MKGDRISNQRGLVWTNSPPSKKSLRADGYKVNDFRDLREDFINAALSAGTKRPNLDRAAESILKLLDDNPKLAILNVPTSTPGDIRLIYSYIVEPAFRRDTNLLLGADRDIHSLDHTETVEPDIGYAWSLERLKYLAQRYRRTDRSDGLPPLTPIEDQLLDALRSKDLTPQVQYGIGQFRVDVAFPEVRVAVEADGRAWHDAVRDAARDSVLKSKGWEVLRYSGSAIYRDADEVAREVAAQVDTRRSSGVFYSDIPEEPRSRTWWQRLIDWLLRRSSQDLEALEQAKVETENIEPTWKANLDSEQKAAVNAAEGVVQVIAPAGSGKTTTMVTRVQELISRGVPSNRILCTTFNRASIEELEKRLKASGVEGPSVKSFHALGRIILFEEDQLRASLGTVSYAQFRRIAKLAMDGIDAGVWIDAPAASEVISDYKLAKMWTPQEARRRATKPTEITAAEIYRIYEEQLEQADRNDFDDLIIKAVQLLQQNPDARTKWQDHWETVLVDEFQDIEPAQELLIQLVAAPQDSIFAVGDEDQCIYSWRRASVERIVMLDTIYPGLERVVLKTSYRCPPRITEAATRLISSNQRRFPKEINPSPVSNHEGEVELITSESVSKGAQHVAEILAQFDDPKDVVVLARTSRLLREVVRASIDKGVPVRASDNALRPSDAEQTVLAYIRLASSSETAIDEDIRQSFRVPNRYLPQGAEAAIGEALQSGSTFAEAVEVVLGSRGEEWRRNAIAEWVKTMDKLASLGGHEGVRFLRGEGGLDRHYSSVEQMTPHDQIEIEALEDATELSSGRSLYEFATVLEQRSTRLHDGVDEDGIELTTIHGAKGREWNTVVLFAADADQLPHRRTLAEAENEEAFDEAIEDERRLAYVAITRTKSRLVVVTTSAPSPFLREAAMSSSGPSLPTRDSLRGSKQRI